MPIITISSGLFSGGFTIAEKLADKLQYPCIGREELYRSMERFGLTEELHRSLYSSMLHGNVSPGMRIALINMHRAALLLCAENGNLIYHGAVGHLLLSSISNILKVRVNLSMDLRVQSAMRLRSMNHDEAGALISKDDQECENGARGLYDVNWKDPLLYDVVLNLNHISLDNAVELLSRAAEFEDFVCSPNSKKEFQDLTLGSVVWATLLCNPLTSNANLMVTACGGLVTVYGQVSSEQAATAISDIVRSIEGVKTVSSHVGIGTGGLESPINA